MIGFEGLPTLEKAGNVVYQELKMKVSLRMPPTLKGEDASKVVIEKLTSNPPFNSSV